MRRRIASFLLSSSSSSSLPGINGSSIRYRYIASTTKNYNAGVQNRPRRRQVMEFRVTDSQHFQDWFDDWTTSSNNRKNLNRKTSLNVTKTDHHSKKNSTKYTKPPHQHATIYEIVSCNSDSDVGVTQKWNISQQPLERRSHSSLPSLSEKLKGDTHTHSDNNSNIILRSMQDMREGFWNHVVTHFLPAQYPHSVADGYARFTRFTLMASVAGSAARVLSTQTLLLAVGVVGQTAVANGSASLMAGAISWVIKDGMGQLGGVVFASKMGEMRQFDSDPKRWRMVAALSLDGANFLEILSPLVWSSWVLPIACIASIGKNIGFLTASASRAAIHQSLAIKGNMADVTAKSASQSMAAGLFGTGVGIGLSAILQHDVTNYIAGFCALSMIHQGCSYQRGVRCKSW